MQISRTNLAQLLAANFTAEDIAGKYGLTTAVVEEAIAADPYLVQEVARIRRHSRIDDNLDTIEYKASKRLLNCIDFETDVMKLAKVASLMNSARRRSQGETGGLMDHESAQGVVELVLPKRVEVTHKRNAVNEVVEVNGRPLISKTSQELLKEVAHYEKRERTENGGLPKQLETEDAESPLDLL